MSTITAFDPVPLLAAELKLATTGVAAVVALLSEGNTVPFIARYRKEATGGLDEVQIRTIEERRAYLLELDERRRAVLASIEEQGKLTDDLRARILACETKAALEDLYLPFKKKRRTRGMMARERGLSPLADRILAQPSDGDPLAEAAAFVDEEKGVVDAEVALSGARDIVAEIISEDADIRAGLRHRFAEEGLLLSKVVAAKAEERSKFEQYYDYSEKVKDIPSHRFLAIRRGEAEGILRAHMEIDADAATARIERAMKRSASSPFSAALAEAILDSYRRLLCPSVENDLRVELKLRSDRAAVDVFADNLRNLLLSPPLGPRAVIGIDPGLRTGCKCAATDTTGKFLGTVTLYLTRGDAALARAREDLLAFIATYEPAAIAVGNGTGGRETESFVRSVLKDRGITATFVIAVNEAGASIYSASDVAREEFPELDLTIRGAISIARRLQDPLAELVKIEPKAIGVGQYQHDVHQPLMKRKLGEVVESCVNHVGVELNTASASLLSYVAGIGGAAAKKIVGHREKCGAFRSRAEVLKVPGLGPKAFQQCAGFLRIRDGAHPLDASAVHPERYALVEAMASDLGVAVGELVGDRALADRIDLGRYLSDGVGEPTLRDIIAELKKPGRDPRKSFEPPTFRDDVNTMEDLVVGMTLEGAVTNVTAFGAFVDVGVHQDGLVHISQLSDTFVKDPKDVVRVGDTLKVRVLEVDLVRKRIALSARRDAAPTQGGGKPARTEGRDHAGPREQANASRSNGPRKPAGGAGGQPRAAPTFSNNPFARALRGKP